MNEIQTSRDQREIQRMEKERKGNGRERIRQVRNLGRRRRGT